jgi:hypothetical protein
MSTFLTLADILGRDKIRSQREYIFECEINKLSFDMITNSCFFVQDTNSPPARRDRKGG